MMKYSDIDILVKRSNVKSKIWECFKENNQLGLAEVTEKTGFMKCNVSAGIRDLIDCGVLERLRVNKKIVRGEFIISKKVVPNESIEK